MKFRLFLAAATALAGTAVLTPASPLSAATADLFISEYIEGSSNNKAIEIYNGTGSAVDLAAGGYSLEMYFNGSASPGLTLGLSGTVADGDVYVVAQASAAAAILAQADRTSGSGFFNGDDAVVLRKGTAVVDSIGQVGFDPGSEWGSGLVSTQDNTLRRKAGVCAGDTNISDAFDPAPEWDGFATDTFDGLGAHTANCGVVSGPSPVINEFSASTTGADVEYVEIYGAPSADLSNLTVLEIEGDTTGAGIVDEVIAVGTLDTAGFGLLSLPANALENGTLTLLLVDGFSGTLGQDLDTNNDGAFDVTPWTTIVDAVAVNDGGTGDVTYAGGAALGPNYDGVSSFAPGGASRFPDGADTDTTADWVRNDFDLAGIPGFAGTPTVGEALNTPGAPNQIVVPPPTGFCGDPATVISAIQGNGAASPLAGTTQTIEAVVVGDFQDGAAGTNGDLNGFHVQEEDADADADPLTSEGIFVFDGSSPAVDVQIGDRVRVVGSVSEFFGMTQISATGVLRCGTAAAPTRATLALPVTSVTDFEPYEGMSVTFPQALVISEYFNFDRFGEIVLTSQRNLTPTAEVEPGPAAIAEAQNYLLDRITLDDGRTNQNPDPAIHPNGGVFDLTNLFRGGDTVANVTGVMDFGFGLYRIQPTQGADHTVTNPRTAAPDPVGGSITVASFNVLNYFNTLDYPSGNPLDNPCGPLNNLECRGADDANERDRQLAKIVAAMATIDADVFGIIEVENSTGVEAMDDIVGGLNAAAGFAKYAYVDTGTIGTDAIKVGLIYQPATVTPTGPFAILDSSVDPRFIDTKSRPALAQTFVETADGAAVTVVVNHLKSKGSSCNDVGDPDVGDGAGNCNLTRKAAAEALVDWLAGDPTGSGDADVLIVGDLNSYDKEEPIDVLVAAGYTDLLASFVGEAAYSYVFDGQVGYLDYGLSSPSLTPQVTGATAWHVNADEPDLIDYDTTFKQAAQDAIYAPDAYRSSDHDPVIIGLDLNAPPVCSAAAPSIARIWPPNHQMVAVDVLGVTDPDGDPTTITIDSIFQDEAVDAPGSGSTAPDGAGVGTSTAMLRAERSAVGDGRAYHVAFTATDTAGNTCSGSVLVGVPKSSKSAVVDGGALFDSTAVPPGNRR